MKRSLTIALAALLLAGIAGPAAHAQLRADVGAVGFLGGGYVTHAGSELDAYFTLADRMYIPLFDGGLYIQSGEGPVRLAAGARIWSLLGLINVAYPAVKLEIGAGPLTLDAGIGGYWFGHWISERDPGFGTANILLPEASVWLSFGKDGSYRLGAGAVGAFTTAFDFRTLPFLYYVGGRLVLD